MAGFCLLPEAVQKFRVGLKDGTIDPAKLSQMTSEERNKFFEQFVGKANSTDVNALFESKLLLKNQKQGMITWAKNVAGLKEYAKQDLISKIGRMDRVLDPEDRQAFLKDLASTKLGINVTQDEAKSIADLSKQVVDTRVKAGADFTFPSETDRLAHGAAIVNLENYVGSLKLQTEKIGFNQPLRKIKNMIGNTPGVLKSMVSSLDNSFFGRQGIKTLLNVRTSHIWIKAFVKSWGDIGRELKGTDAINLIKADILSRPNALNGKYHAGNYGLTAFSEEAYPSSAPAKIPLFGRLFKASESAYNGAALRMRADLADRYIKIAEKQGINTLNREQAQGIGVLVGGMTGRVGLGKGEALAKEINVLMFSIKFLRSNFDTLTLYAANPAATSFARKEAAKNLATMVGSVASVLSTAYVLNPSSVDFDPRSTNFGKVKLFGHWTDITGGMSAIAILAARLTPTQHNGQWGLWEKSRTGNYTNLLAGKFGQQTALDIINSFFEGKLSPFAGIFRDVFSGQTYSGQTPTIKGELLGATTPISVQTFNQLMKDPNSSSVLGSMIADVLGLSVATSKPPSSNWNKNPGKELTQFRDKVGADKFNQANQEFNSQLQTFTNNINKNTEFKALSSDQQKQTISLEKTKLQKDIFRQYGFRYRQQRGTNYQLRKFLQ